MISDIVKQVRCVDSNKVVSIPAGVDLRKFDSRISGEKIREELADWDLSIPVKEDFNFDNLFIF